MKSSGNILADKRFAYAGVLEAEGDTVAAADLFAQATELVPNWAPGWLALGRALERSGQSDNAAKAYEAAEALDRDGLLGAALHRARLEGRHDVVMPTPFIATLFDQYADRFEHHLRHDLRYQAPEMIATQLETVAPGRRFAAVLDLGCGTGLMGRALADRAEAIDGVDLSPRMVEKAQGTGFYRHVVAADMDAVLTSGPPERFDLVVAADVLVYVGALDACVAHVGTALRPDGLFAFTVQRGDDEPFRLGADMRFSHGGGYIRAVLARTGLVLDSLDERSTRRDGGAAVPGLVVVARKP